ncbi:hypothetical protein K2173_015400 [Erythroxylum novogranatense]|uniref:Uncharacterized protein n=1 Tax=Erythroxylum novogranatense TaxID=1862640 RepID=A0AAV8SRN3_9ROSI|nr:hypothetical protein K2173_015400 [Erythroxylum novogranatense]
MEIQENLVKYKYHIIFTLITSLILASLLFLAPSFFTILAYFWPLLLSTALFLAAVVIFGNTTSTSGDKAAGEGLLDYVAGQPEHAVESFKLEGEELKTK